MTDTGPLLPPRRFPLLAALLICAYAALTWQQLPVPGEPPRGYRSLLRNVHLCEPGEDAAGPLVDLLWADGRILEHGEPGSLNAQGAREYDGYGGYVAPALADAAVFLSLEGRHPADSVPARPENSLWHQSQSGVGLLLDLNAHRAFIQAARKPRPRSPRAHFAGALFSSPGGWRLSGQTPWSSHVVELLEPEDAEAPWGRALRFGDEAVFASVEHEGRDGLALPLPVLQRLRQHAHSQGLPFLIHVQHSAKALEALEAEPDALVGPLFEAGDGALAQAMRRQGVAYLPCLSVLLNAFPEGSARAWLASFSAVQRMERATLAQAVEPARVNALARHWQRQGADPAQALGVPRRLLDAGVRLRFATGSGQPLVFHGLGAQTEIAHLSRGGVSAAEILEMAARSDVRDLDGRAARLDPGGRADLLLLESDPFQDPSALARPQRVFLGGQLVEP